MALVTSQTEKKKKAELQKVVEKRGSKKLTISDLIIPIASSIVLLVLCFAVFIPMVRSAFEYMDEMKEIDQKIEQLDKLNKQLDQLDESQLSDDVLTSRTVVPNTLLVSDLVYYIDNLAKSLNLQISKLSSADSLNSVSGPLGYEGEYTNVIDFLDKAQNVSPYMIRLENIKLSRRNKNDGKDNWSIDMIVSGYYISDSEEEPSIYSNFKPYTQHSDILEIFREKAKSTL
jgi:cell division protein FtsL